MLSMDHKPFSEMENSFFSFDAYTKLWLGFIAAIPADLMSDARKIRQYLLTPGNESCDEVLFAGRITIYRGTAKRMDDTGAWYLPMSVVAMEEFGYAKTIGTTIGVTADFTKPNFGYTHQMSASSLLVPADARMLMTLRLSGVNGKMADAINQAGATVSKEIAATVHSFPFTNGGTLFQHVGDKARPIVSDSGDVLGYLAHGIMIPQGPVAREMTEHVDAGKLAEIPTISFAQNEFLMRRTAVVGEGR